MFIYYLYYITKIPIIFQSKTLIALLLIKQIIMAKSIFVDIPYNAFHNLQKQDSPLIFQEIGKYSFKMLHQI